MMREQKETARCHTVVVRDTAFRFRVRLLETDFLFADGTVRSFPNWDVKGVREHYYMEEYVNVPAEDYLRESTSSREAMEHGIMASDVRLFVEGKFSMFEDLLLDSCGEVPLE